LFRTISKFFLAILRNLEEMQIIEAISKKIKEKGISVLRLSKETDIPATRLYKWLDNKAKPKYEDITKLEKWLNDLEKVPNGTTSNTDNNTVHIEYKPSMSENYKEKYLALLEKHLETIERTEKRENLTQEEILKNQKTMIGQNVVLGELLQQLLQYRDIMTEQSKKRTAPK
jgi:transcriptional regulator with XRE-family HTH domain